MKNNITYFLEQKCMSQRDFARALGTTEVSVSRYIKGEREPKATVCIKMAKILGCTAEELFPEEDLSDECALKALENIDEENSLYQAAQKAIAALKENQLYKQIGTVEEIETSMKYLRIAKLHGTIGKVIEACEEYESIGTVEDVRDVVENFEKVKEILKSGGSNDEIVNEISNLFRKEKE